MQNYRVGGSSDRFLFGMSLDELAGLTPTSTLIKQGYYVASMTQADFNFTNQTDLTFSNISNKTNFYINISFHKTSIDL